MFETNIRIVGGLISARELLRTAVYLILYSLSLKWGLCLSCNISLSALYWAITNPFSPIPLASGEMGEGGGGDGGSM